MVWFMSRYDIMYEHDNQRDVWLLLVERGQRAVKR